jgi:hypothetical protein
MSEGVNIDNILTKGFLKLNTFVSYDYENIAKQSLFDWNSYDGDPTNYCNFCVQVNRIFIFS